MINYLRKYPTKRLPCLFLVAACIIIAITISGNVLLNKYKDVIIRAIDTHTSQKAFIKSIVYLPPGFILIKGISFSQSPPENKQFLVIPACWVRFSLLGIIIKRRFSAASISFYHPRANYHQFSKLIKNNFLALIDFIKHLPKQDIKLAIKAAELGLGEKQGAAGDIRADFLLKIKGNSIIGSGLISKETANLAAPAVRYNFRGFLRGGGFSLENLELKSRNLYAQFWGVLTGSIFKMNGFIFANTAFRQSASEIRPRALSSGIDLSLVSLCILDIDCQLNFAFPSVGIEHLNLLLNNNPIAIKGTVDFLDKVLLDLMLSFGPAKLERNVTENLKKIDLALKATLKNMVFNGSGILHFDFIKKKKASPPLDKLRFDFQDLGLHYECYPRVKISLGKLDLFCETESNKYRLLLEDVHADLHLKHDRYKYMEFDARFYDGFLKGRARMDLTGPFPKISSSIKVEGVTANKLEDVLIHFSKVYGELDGRMYFSTYPALGLSGSLHIQNGYLHNFEFFKWLADFFALAPLKKIDFSNAYSNFTVTYDGAGLYAMGLDSPQVDLGGYFKLGINDFVSSKMSLTLTKQLLAESPKFVRLLKLVSPDLDALTFKFQLSGILHRMNFKWLKSDLKRELQERIPNFIERKIERDVEEAIEDVSQGE